MGRVSGRQKVCLIGKDQHASIEGHLYDIGKDRCSIERRFGRDGSTQPRLNRFRFISKPERQDDLRPRSAHRRNGRRNQFHSLPNQYLEYSRTRGKPHEHGVHLDAVLDACPDIFSHNMETVKRLQRPIRKTARYDRSLWVLEHARSRGFITKSGIMLGIGEKEDEVKEVMKAISSLTTALPAIWSLN